MHSDHPSPESLNAYFDRELPEEDRASLDTHLSGCPACRGDLKAFEALAGMAPDLDPAVPGESYWADLPDRILARIATDPLPAERAREGFWSRLWHPQGIWRYAVGTTAGVALAAGAWGILHGPPNPWRPGDVAQIDPTVGSIPTGNTVPAFPVSSDPRAAAEQASAPAGTEPESAPMTPLGGAGHIPGTSASASNSWDDIAEMAGAPPVSPDSYNRRVIVSMGSPSNPGTSLDILPGQENRSFTSSVTDMGTTVTEGLPPLGLEARREADPVVSYGCGDNPLEQAYMNALRAEQDGNYPLAAMGYQAVRANLQPGQRLYHAADYRLNVLLWRERVQRAYAPQRAQVLSDLQNQMLQAIAVWEKSGLNRDCQKAQCMTRVFMALGPEVTNPSQMNGTQVTLQQFKKCLD